MTLNYYQELAQRTSWDKNADRQKNGLNLKQLENGLMGLCGESGECMEILKKHRHQGHRLDVKRIAEELGDVLWYCAETASGLGIDLEKIAMDNITMLIDRYPDGFESERSINREGK